MFNIAEMKKDAANGNTTAMWRLSMMHLEGMLPDAQEGIRLLERLSSEPYNRHGARLELGLRYYKGSHVPKDTAKGLEMIEQAVIAQGDDAFTEHCYEAGMIFASVTGSNGEKVEKYQRLSKRLLEKVFADTEWVNNFVKISPDGDQAVLLLKNLLENVNRWLDINQLGED